MKPIKLLGPSCSQAEIKAVTEVLESGWWGTGPKTEEFEKNFAEFVGTKYCVAVNSCTSALHLSVRSLRLKRELKEPTHPKLNIVVPSLTFVSTALAGLYEGLEVRFADVEEESMCLDPIEAVKQVDENTLAVLPVHYGGNTAMIEPVAPIIEDCAHASGNPDAGKKGIMSCWSFHPVKNIATGDMGAITTNDDWIYQKLIPMRWCGIDLETWKREGKGYNWEYFIEDLGYKYNTNDIMAAIALVQLDRLKEMNKRREEIARKYTVGLRDLPLKLPIASGSWHLFVVRVNAKDKGRFVEYLRKNNISPGVHYKPVHWYPIFGSKDRWHLPVTEKLYQEIVSLPIYPDLTDTEQQYIIDKIKQFYSI